MQNPNQNNQNYIHIRSIATDLILSIITCGLFNVYVQYRQIIAVNEMLKNQKYDFVKWALFTILTCGLYHIYHEWTMHKDICMAMNKPESDEPLASLLLSCFGLSLVADAIQQASINRYYGSQSL